MHTVTADKYKRVRLPDAKPQQVFAYANTGENITLTPIKTEHKPRFPKGSLVKYPDTRTGPRAARNSLRLRSPNLMKSCWISPTAIG